ncbi:protein of unknown function (plasmid) [Cupriavidus taiwanensis]|uniref:Uncharacterized protein n=1 Tax=Cupriavidus taiwanensis TaxID=164546 RepID=A0A375IPF4_9BURK|nr:protein of unknown function [Cupriavidus taiwanensis]
MSTATALRFNRVVIIAARNWELL